MQYCRRDLARSGARCTALVAMVTVAACAPASQTSQGAYATSTQRALEYLPDGETLDWVDPETEATSRVTVLNTREEDDGLFCRDFVTAPVPEPDETVADTTEEAEPQTYCRDPDSGRWEPSDRMQS